MTSKTIFDIKTDCFASKIYFIKQLFDYKNKFGVCGKLMKFMIEAVPSFYHKCEGKLHKGVHMLPVHPGVQMSIGQDEPGLPHRL